MVRGMALVAAIWGVGCTVSTTGDDTGEVFGCPDYTGFGVEASWVWSTPDDVAAQYGAWTENGASTWLNDSGTEVELLVSTDYDDAINEYSYLDVSQDWLCDSDGAHLVAWTSIFVVKPWDEDAIESITEVVYDTTTPSLPSTVVDGTVWTASWSGTRTVDGAESEDSGTQEYMALELDDIETPFGTYGGIVVQQRESGGDWADLAWRNSDIGRLKDTYVTLDDYVPFE